MNIIRVFITLFFLINYYTQFTGLKNLEVIILVYSVFELYSIRRKISFPTLIFFLVFIFVNMSILFANLILGDLVFIFWRAYDEFYFFRGLCALGMSISSMFFAVSLFKVRKPYKKKVIFDPALEKVGVTLLLISLPIALISLFYGNLGLMVNEGYGAFTDARKEGGLSRLLVLTLSYFLPWLSIISFITLFRNPPLLRKIVIIAIIFFSIFISILSGDRTGISISIVGMLISYEYLKEIKLSLFKLGVLGFSLLIIFNVVKEARRVGYGSYSISDNTSENSNEISLVGELSLIMSNQFQSMPATIKLLNEGTENYRFGLDLVRSTVQSIPFGTSILKELGHNPRERKSGIFVQPTQWISYHLNERESMSGVGFLMIAESFLNFGLIGVIFIPAILIYFIEKTYRKLLKGRHKTSHYFFNLVFFLQLLIWIRNDSTSLIFTLILIHILFFLSRLKTFKIKHNLNT